MLVPLSWLKEYVDISDIPVTELRKRMSASGLAVERQHVVGERIESIVVGEIINQQKHPDSDHLWVCQINIGKKIADRDLSDDILQAVQIITGAQNVFEGAKVPVILPGSQLPDGTKIESAKMRGWDSQGMLCSERELGLGEGHEGIMILGNDACVGESLVTYLGLPDVVFDVEITSNRGDCLSMVGIAREVATLFGKELRMPTALSLENPGKSELIPAISVTVEDPKKCARFSVVGLDGFHLGTSPMWMQQRLLRAGMRPINNLVDITNYVMLELGQPSHAYDALHVTDKTFVIRSAKPGEVLQTLDEKKFTLEEGMLVIADTEKSLGLAGIMGGNSSKITEDTRSLLLEVANFNPVSIRQTGMKLAIRSEAILRFERGIDVGEVPCALSRLHYLFHEYAQAHLVTPVVEVYAQEEDSAPVTLTSRLLTTYLGESMSCSSAERILNSLGFETKEKTGDDLEWRLTVGIPSWRRRDVSIEEDLIEEVTRIYGYDNLKIATPVGSVPFVPKNKKLAVKLETLDVMRGLGFQEILTYSFNSKDQIESSGYAIEQALEMANPLSEEQRYLRMSLLPNLLWTLEKNKHLKQNLQLFELSSVYHRTLFDVLPEEAVGLQYEPLYLSGFVMGEHYSFDDAYRVVHSVFDSLSARLQILTVTFTQNSEKLQKMPSIKMFHPGRVGGVILDGKNCVGLFGEIHPKIQEGFGLKQASFVFDVAFMPFVELATLTKVYHPFSVFPETTEALSFILNESQLVGEIVDTLRSLDSRIVKIEVGQPYRGNQIDFGKKAITFTFVFQSIEGPIKEQDAQTLRDRITSLVTSLYKGELRR